jgi:hypothetical protein
MRCTAGMRLLLPVIGSLGALASMTGHAAIPMTKPAYQHPMASSSRVILLIASPNSSRNIDYTLAQEEPSPTPSTSPSPMPQVDPVPQTPEKTTVPGTGGYMWRSGPPDVPNNMRPNSGGSLGVQFPPDKGPTRGSCTNNGRQVPC